jgi:HEAT repeat protein
MEALSQHPDAKSNPEIEALLLAGVLDASPEVAATAAYCLCRIDPQRHADAVHKLVSHRLAAFRCAGAGLIGKLAPTSRGQLLKPLLTDPDAAVRHAAFQTLTAIKAVRAA